ncbi:MAG TPA: hypothetical protein VMU64_13575 [Acidimicrobiales bacterium]|nr:hypothetical protein [Acidimicrobiales bacterium]
MTTLIDLSPSDLRHLAAAIDGMDPAHQPRRRLTQEAAGELAEMLVAGKVPTIGWWRKHPRPCGES